MGLGLGKPRTVELTPGTWNRKRGQVPGNVLAEMGLAFPPVSTSWGPEVGKADY